MPNIFGFVSLMDHLGLTNPEEQNEKIFDVVDDCLDQSESVCRNGGSPAFWRGRQLWQAADNDSATGSKGACGSARSDSRRTSCPGRQQVARPVGWPGNWRGLGRDVCGRWHGRRYGRNSDGVARRRRGDVADIEVSQAAATNRDAI